MRLRSGRTIGVNDNAQPNAETQQEDISTVAVMHVQQAQATARHAQQNVEDSGAAVVLHYSQTGAPISQVQGLGHSINPSVVDIAPAPALYQVESPQSAEEQIERMVGAFCNRTEALAGEHAILLARQQQQAQKQQEALHAVHTSAQQNVEQLAGHQRATELAIHNALVDTRNVLLQQLQQLAKDQNESNNAIRHEVNQQLCQMLQEAQQSTQALVNQQAQETLLVEQRMAAALTQAHAELSSRIGLKESECDANTATSISDQIDARLSTLHDAISNQVEGLVFSAIDASRVYSIRRTVDRDLVDEAAEDEETRIEQLMRLALQQSQQEFATSFEEKARARETTMRRDMEALIHLAADDTESRIEEKLRRALNAAQDETRVELKRQADETSSLRERLDAHEVNVHSRLDSLSSRVTAIERSGPISSFGLVSRLNVLEKKVQASESIEQRLEALEKSSARTPANAALQARVNDLELQMAKQLRINAMTQVPASTKPPTFCAPQNWQGEMEADMNYRINAALTQATASIDALATRYASDAAVQAAKLEMKVKSLLSAAKPQQVPQPRRIKRPTCHQTKQQIIAVAQRAVKDRAEAAAARFDAAVKPKHRIIVHID